MVGLTVIICPILTATWNYIRQMGPDLAIGALTVHGPARKLMFPKAIPGIDNHGIGAGSLWLFVSA